MYYACLCHVRVTSSCMPSVCILMGAGRPGMYAGAAADSDALGALARGAEANEDGISGAIGGGALTLVSPLTARWRVNGPVCDECRRSSRRYRRLTV